MGFIVAWIIIHVKIGFMVAEGYSAVLSHLRRHNHSFKLSGLHSFFLRVSESLIFASVTHWSYLDVGNCSNRVVFFHTNFSSRPFFSRFWPAFTLCAFRTGLPSLNEWRCCFTFTLSNLLLDSHQLVVVHVSLLLYNIKFFNDPFILYFGMCCSNCWI